MRKITAIFLNKYNSSKLTLLLLLFITQYSFAQYTLRIEIVTTPGSSNTDNIFVAGNFNNWNPSDANFLFEKKKNILVKEIKDLPAAVYEFKFTHGSWDKVETTSSGGDITNRDIRLGSDTTIRCSIAAWKDDFAKGEQPHTASAQVSKMDTAFYMPQLDRKRNVWIYLPKDYPTSAKRYPVLYMHDGQNIFDERTAGFGEWGVDECLDSLIAKGKAPCIVVGIDNGPQRMNEYNPYNNARFGKGEGDAYIDFIVFTLKPFIDKHYRTLPANNNTIIAGSSMGGLISYYAMLKYPEVFGKAGVFSPSFWIAPQINNMTDSLAKRMDGKLFFYAGQMESEEMVNDMKVVMDKLGADSKAMIYSVIDPEGKHNEQAWRKWFAEFYLWMMADGFNRY